MQTYIYFGVQQCTDGNAVSVDEVFSSASSLFSHLQFPRQMVFGAEIVDSCLKSDFLHSLTGFHRKI